MDLKLSNRKKVKFVAIVAGVVLLYALLTSGANIPFTLGNYYFGGGAYNIKLAKKLFDVAYKIDPKFPGVNYQIGRTYFIQGNFALALNHINREIELFPDYKRSYYMRGLINGYAENLEQAASDFETFLVWKPESWAGHNDLVWIYFKMGDYVKAEKVAREGLLYSPENPWLLNSLGVALLNNKKYQEAESSLKKSLTGFQAMDASVWGYSYPGNNPKIYGEGLEATIKSVEKNLKLVQEKQVGITR